MTESPKPPPRPAAPREPRESARDTLAPSSFGVLGNKSATPKTPENVRPARAPLNTLGELEGVSATATLRPPGAVPPPPRSLPQPAFDVHASEPRAGDADAPFPPLATDPAAGPRSRPFGPRPHATPFGMGPDDAARAPHARAAATDPDAVASGPNVDPALESTLDMSGSASKKATQAALIEQSRVSSAAASAVAKPASAVPAPGLFIADEPVEPRPPQPSLVTQQRRLLTRMRVAVLVLGGLLLMAAGALVVMIFRRAEAGAVRSRAVASASARPEPPGCRLALPPTRISATIERTVPLSVEPRADGTLALAIADTKTTAAGWLYDPLRGEPLRQLGAAAVDGDVTHVTAGEPLLVDRALPDFAFGQTLSRGLALGVGPAGLLRRGDDGATGVVFALPTGARVTAPRVASLGGTHFVVFRQGGAEGRIMTGWLNADGTARGELAAVAGAPRSLGTPAAATFGDRALTLFSARADKSEPYELYAASAALGAAPEPARKLALPVEGGGAIAPSLSALPSGRFLLQWTDGSVGHYQVRAIVLGAELEPLGPALQVSAKGANAGQGAIVTTSQATVSFFIQTTAGHDELWGATLACR